MRRYRIGLMVGNKSIDYVRTIRMGVQNTLEEQGHTLIAISDLIPFHSRSNAKAYFRVAFEVASRLNLDAIIVPAGIITGYLVEDHASLDDFLGILDPSKTLVIERKIDGYRSIYKDNAPGMHECMKYLIEDRGLKKIAFIGGPETSTGARERENIYFEEMAAHDLLTYPSLIAHGELSGECGDSIENLIDDNPGLEAIACCCDLIAHSVYQVMRRRRLAVGTDIAVTGFDDHELSAHLDPPLSTVHMTGYDLGCMAAREAILLCEGKPQEEEKLSSVFIARGSCGEHMRNELEEFRVILKQRPLPIDEITDILVQSTLSMAGKHVTADFTSGMRRFVEGVRTAFLQHLSSKSPEDQLFTPQDLSLLFNRSYRERLSLEGFHSVAISMLQALVEEAPEDDAGWVLDQVSNLHLGIARMLNVEVQENKLAMSEREWVSFHMTDDALRESTNPKSAYRLILQEFSKLGVRKAEIYLLPEPVSFIGARTFALSDTIVPIGRLSEGRVSVARTEESVALQQILDRLLPRYGGSTTYTVGGVMAGDELVGVAAIDSGTLDEDGQLIAFLNLGIALKHLQMIATERESNELLSKSNLLLERQSHYDEMTGTLNRRGFMNKLSRILNLHQGQCGALFYLDLDGLKIINDSFGHESGDEAICQTTRVLGACLPPDAVIGRLGGDEFVAFVLVKDEGDMASLGTTIDASVATFNATHSYPFDLSISYGGVLLDVDDKTFSGINESLVIADERLYEMKKRKGTVRK